MNVRNVNMASNKELHERRLAATPRGIAVGNSFFIDRAENAELWDVEGRRYIDFGGGIAVLNTGHRHPKVMAAVAEQLERFTHSCYQVVPYESYVTLAEKINQLTPGTHAKKTAFFSTGAEAVENVVKIARAATKRSGIIAFSGAFHGRSMMAAALTGKVVPYKVGFGPFPGEIFHAPFPVPLHGVSVQDSLDFIQHLFKSDIEPARVAAIILEPVQGEGGFYQAPVEFMVALRKLCDEHGILLVADEVQTGFGRTGKWFAMEHYPVLPDIMTMAKSMAGGTTLSAVCGRAEIMDAPLPGGLGGTYAGSPMAIAASHAVIEVIEAEGLLARSNALGEKLKGFLNEMRAKVPQIVDVRGPGSMVAVEFNDPATGKPDADFTKRVQARALEKGLILLTCGVYGNVLRLLYPLTTPDAIFDEAMGILAEALQGS
ncbi:4-aminobutyrate--2-oxoglutarate transaminase [Niveibacterium umoris]|uniref:4-aminobutyrate aminotransferase n=2 Tax=Niveibacterium umoris TaxID=1193620 RepID=A0A840BJB8_9RHOO|nr:4-aminobutyrate--2-oxoglutarate transaminase [Niveibacterium umoris]MBB4011006.1 4-aminobutyrate aminotransferase [Niveibacterium umoris]